MYFDRKVSLTGLLSIISTAIKLIKYNITDESKFEITGKDFMEPQQ
jgi:hypothetical protein